MRVGACLISIALVTLASGASGSPYVRQWQIEVLSPLQTRKGELIQVVGRDLNDRGQVAGTAWTGLFLRAAFRYTPRVGLEDLDPDRRYRSESVVGGALNESGDVLGRTYDRHLRQSGVFVYRDGNGFDFLDKGLTEAIATGFDTFPGQSSLADDGHFCGSARLPSGQRRAFLYGPRRGWIDLTPVHPRFVDEDGVYCKYTNAVGDLVFSIANPPDPGEEPPFAHQEAFVRVGGGEPVELPTFGRLVNVTGAINAAGLVPGLYVDAAGLERAYVWTPASGQMSIHPQRFAQSAALYATADSTVWGVLRRGAYNDHVFSWRQETGLRVEVRAPKLRRIARRYGLEFTGVSIVGANDGGAIVGLVSGEGQPFYYSRETGLIDLRARIEKLGEDFRPLFPVQVNDRGDVLIVGTSRTPSPRLSTAILSMH